MNVATSFDLFLSQSPQHVAVANGLQHLECFLFRHQAVFRIWIGDRDATSWLCRRRPARWQRVSSPAGTACSVSSRSSSAVASSAVADRQHVTACLAAIGPGSAIAVHWRFARMIVVAPMVVLVIVLVRQAWNLADWTVSSFDSSPWESLRVGLVLSDAWSSDC